MNEEKDVNTEDSPQEFGVGANTFVSSKKPPLYSFLYVIVVGLCVTGITWVFRSGVLQLWDRHPLPGENYEIGWFFSLLFAIPAGFLIGSYLMFQFLMWYQSRLIRKTNGGEAKGS